MVLMPLILIFHRIKNKFLQRKNDVYDWNPAGVSGSITGSYPDVSVFMALQVDSTGRTYMPFNFGWGDHFPWNNGHIY